MLQLGYFALAAAVNNDSLELVGARDVEALCGCVVGVQPAQAVTEPALIGAGVAVVDVHRGACKGGAKWPSRQGCVWVSY